MIKIAKEWDRYIEKSNFKLEEIPQCNTKPKIKFETSLSYLKGEIFITNKRSVSD